MHLRATLEAQRLCRQACYCADGVSWTTERQPLTFYIIHFTPTATFEDLRDADVEMHPHWYKKTSLL